MITVLQSTRVHNPCQLHDELIAAGLAPSNVFNDAAKTEIYFPTGTVEANAAPVINAHVPKPPPNPVAIVSSLSFWKSDATASTASQGLNLPSALTELDSTLQGTREAVAAADIGAQVQIAVTMRTVVGAAGLNIVVSIRDASNTANVLATLTLSGATVNTQAIKGAYVAKPAWLTGDKVLAVYTSGGNGSADFIFKSVSLRWKS